MLMLIVEFIQCRFPA